MSTEMRRVDVNTFSNGARYGISIGAGILENAGTWARQTLGPETRKLMIVSNRRVFGLYGESVAAGLRAAGFDVRVWLMNDGERFKSLRSCERLLRRLGEDRFSRTDAVAALGGGVVGDLAGFASAIYLRGIEFLQIPTTLLSMIDSSVGGKTGVNTEFGKNLIGAFHHPTGVLVDVAALKTLARREIVAGFCEAVKHAVLSGGEVFNMTRDFLGQHGTSNYSRRFESPDFAEDLVALIATQVGFKALIVAGDQSEETGRTDARSRKILNFGHTFGHALEKVTAFKRFKHGEAVGLGMLFAANLSKSLELLDTNQLNLLNDVVRLVGRLPDIRMIDPPAVLGSIQSDKKNIAGDVQWILLEGIGKPVIVSSKNVPEMSIRNCLDELLTNQD